MPLSTLLGDARIRIRPDLTGFEAVAQSSIGTSFTKIAKLAGVTLGLAGAAAFAKSTLAIGKTYQDTLNNLQAISGASIGQMQAVGAEAKKLGSDLTLTSTSAADAATAMTELAKGGLTVDAAMKAAHGTLQLAAAAGISAAEAATIQSAALNAYSLNASQAGHVANVLANAANAAAGEIGDFAKGMSQASAVAAATGISLEDTAATLGLLANNGIRGSDAGTLLKSALLALQSPSKPAQKAMEDLSLSAYDASGNFVGLSSIFGQLAEAQAHMTPQMYAMATSTLFGSDAARLAGIAAKEGAVGFNKMATAMEKSGSAADVAAAKAKGVGGAIEAFKSQMETFQIDLFERLAPVIEKVVRVAASAFATLSEAIGGVLTVVFKLLTPLGKLAVFLSDHEDLALALGVAFGVYLAGGITAAQVAMNRFLLTPVVLGISAMLSGITALSGIFSGGFVAALATARAALIGFLTTAAPLAAVAAIAYGVVKTVEIWQAAGKAKDEIKGMWDAANDARGPAQLTALDDRVSKIQEKVSELRFNLSDDGAWETTILGAWLTGAAADTEALKQYEIALKKAKAAQVAAAGTAADLGEKYHLTQKQVTDLAEKYDINLTAGAASVNRVWEKSGAAAEVAAGGIARVGNTAELSSTQIEEATQAAEDWAKASKGSLESFVGPLDAYKSLLSDKTEAERAAAQAVADSTKDSKDSWKDYVKDVGLSLDEYAQKLQAQLDAQANWRKNIVTITQAGGLEVGQALQNMGIEGAGLVQQMVDAIGTEQFPRLVALISAQSAAAGQGAANNFNDGMKIMAEVGRDGADNTVQQVATKLGIGADTVRTIAAQFGIALAEGINPLLTALGSKPFSAPVGSAYAKMGGYWDGGYTGDGGKFEPKGVVHGGEFVFTKEETSRAGVQNLASLAASLRGYASGGFVSISDIPRPLSTAPYAPPLSTAGDAAMAKEYEQAKAWMQAHAESLGGPAGSGSIGGGAWQSIFNIVKAAFPQARVNSAYRPGDPGYHGKGKAVDFGFGTGPGGAGSAGLASIARFLYTGYGRTLAELIYDGIGDNTPDIKNGADHVYNAATRSEHQNHVHAAVYDRGGILAPGMTLVNNRSGKPEVAITNKEWGVLKDIASGGSGALIGGDLVLQVAPGTSVTSQIESVNHELRRIRRGGSRR